MTIAAKVGGAGRQRRTASAPDLMAGIEHHKAGRLDRAEALYRKVLQRNPDDVDALHFLGVVAVDRGRPQQGIKLIMRALARLPDNPDAHANLGNAFRAAGRSAEACASYRRALALRPDFAAAHANLGLVLYEQGDPVAALPNCQRAVDLDPRQPEALAALGNVLRSLGQLDRAEAALRAAVRIRSGSAGFRVNLANLLIDMKRPAEAAFLYRDAIAMDPGLARAHHGLGASLMLTGDADSALVCFRSAVGLERGKSQFWNDLGRALRVLGRMDDAVEAFQQALTIDPHFADAHRNLVSCRRIVADDPEIARIAALAEDAMLPDEQRAIAGFALGKALDDADRFDEAFIAFDRANATYRATRAAARFDADALRRQVDETVAAFTQSFFASVADWGSPSELPVFIVGMPRSGTSLVEQIAATHSRVFGAGELKHIGALAAGLPASPADWRRDTVRRLADGHLERLQSLGQGAARVIDKMPDNVFMLGVIATLYPSARIIFCQRDPRDIGLSCFFQKFSPGHLEFSYDLADCGRRYCETARLMAHWRRVLPLRMLDVGYEALVADPEGESRRLIGFLGLEWEPACLDFHLTERPVATASGWQVRQPLYARSVGRWRRYERHLRPLLDVLTEAGPAGLPPTEHFA